MDEVISEDLLNADGVITRNQPTRNASGGWPENYVVKSSPRVRRPFAPSALDQVLAAQLQAVCTHITYTGPDVDIQKLDRLEVEGFSYEVVSVLPPSLPHHLKVMLERRQIGSAT